MNNHFKISVTSLLAILFSSQLMAQSVSVDQIISDQRSRQIARQISDSIVRRVTGDIDDSFENSQLQTNKTGASADSNSYMPDSLWNSFSWSRLSDDGTNFFDVDIYQNTIGLDKKINNFYFGASLTYAYSDTEINIANFNLSNNTHSVSLTPYIAYVINKNFFISALTGYTYTNSNPQSSFVFSSPESETDSYNSEIALNGLKVIDYWFLKGKIGTRYIHGHTKTDPIVFAGTTIVPQTRDNSDSWTYLVDGEAGYSFDNGIRLYTGVLFEYNDPQPSLGQADGVFYYNAGADYSITKAFSLGAKVSTDLNNEDIDLTTVAITARLAL